MSRSHHAQHPSFGKRSFYAAVGCMLALSTGCRFSTNPSEALVDPDAGSQPGAEVAVEAKAPAVATKVVTAGAAADSDETEEQADAATPSSAASAAGAAAPASQMTPPGTALTAPTAPASAAKPPASAMPAAGAKAAPPSVPSDAGAPNSSSDPDGGPADAQTWSDERCNSQLTTCLLEDPLNYAECLRVNAEHNCPEPDAGTPTTTPVTGEDGKPISQACQAQLADCIMRNPTPENANSCTEKARMCKL